VVIPVWNGAATLAKLLDALRLQTADRELFEVIVVDNGSTDETPRILAAYPEFRTLNEPLPGSYRARNTGVAVAVGECVLFTDADCIPAPTWIEAALARVAGSDPLGLVSGRIELFVDDRGAGNAASMFEKMFAFDQEANIASGHCVTANWLCRKADLAGVGGFAEGLLSGGDVECARRFAAAGYAISYDPDMRIAHPIRTTIRQLVSKHRRIVGGQATLHAGQKHVLAKELYRFAREGWRREWKIAISTYPLHVRGRVMTLSAMLTSVEICETLRLACGFPPHRS
jgi:glycosyltransferase involved in cell wall biosynthesis